MQYVFVLEKSMLAKDYCGVEAEHMATLHAELDMSFTMWMYSHPFGTNMQTLTHQSLRFIYSAQNFLRHL